MNLKVGDKVVRTDYCIVTSCLKEGAVGTVVEKIHEGIYVQFLEGNTRKDRDTFLFIGHDIERRLRRHRVRSWREELRI